MGPLRDLYLLLVLKDFAAVFGCGSKLFVDSEELVVLCDAVSSTWCACFDLANACCDSEVCDGRVFGFA